MKLSKALRMMRTPLAFLLALFMLFSVFGCSAEELSDGLSLAGDIIELIGEIDDSALSVTETYPTEEAPSAIDEDGYYYNKDDVALYIHTYGRLPSNFITKDEAEDLGWEGGSVEKFLEGAAIGGDRFGNREGLLPKKDGRVYYECDIDTNGASSRGAKRIVYSNDGLIYYTGDHYEHFTLLYGEE